VHVVQLQNELGAAHRAIMRGEQAAIETESAVAALQVKMLTQERTRCAARK
jgi:hypothetical protein